MPAPTIFAATRRLRARQRMLRLQARPGAPRYLSDEIAADLLERLAFLRHRPARTLAIGDVHRALAGPLAAQGSAVTAAEPGEGFAEEQPFPAGGYDLIASLATLDTVNDLPGALVHLRRALAPGGLLLASLCGAGSLPALRAAMLAADGDRPAPRLHPQVDVRAAAGLLQRAGFADPVADTRTLTVRFAALDRLVGDLRAQGLGNVLARPGPPLTREGWRRARAAFGEGVAERFEIITLTGWSIGSNGAR